VAEDQESSFSVRLKVKTIACTPPYMSNNVRVHVLKYMQMHVPSLLVRFYNSYRQIKERE
jgi:hypothetical protein